MKPALALAISLIVANGLLAQTVSRIPAGYDEHPGTAYALVNGQMLNVVAYKGPAPVVVSNGAKVSAGKAAAVLGPAKEFGAGLVTVEVPSQFPTEGRFWLLDDHKTLPFECTLTADRDLPDAYLALIVFESLGQVLISNPKVVLQGHELGKLEAGRPVSVSMEFPKLRTANSRSWTVLLLSGGVPIRTSLGNRTVDLLLEAFDRNALAAEIAKRTVGDFPLKVFRSKPLKFDDSIKKQYAGQTLDVRVRVSPYGEFYDASISGVTDPKLLDSITTQVRNWLFLPPVVKGKVQPATVSLPLKF